MGIAYPLKPLAEPRSGRYAGCKSAASEVFGCIPHARGAYAAAGNENYCGNLLWQSSVTLLPPGDAGEDSFNNLRYVSDWKRLRNIYWLKLPHHGSKRNITCAMINHFRPTVAYVTSKSYGTWLSKAVVNALKQIKTKVYASNVNGAMLHNKIKDRDDYSPAEPL